MRRFATAVVAAAAITVTSCGAGSSSSPPVVKARTEPPTALRHCVSEVTFWTPKTLAHDPAADYGDYQDLGLTAAEYAVLKQTVVVTSRNRPDAASPARWSSATKAYVATYATAACRVVVSQPHPTSTSSYGWPTG